MQGSRAISVTLVAGGMMVGGGIAYAAIPSTDGVIHGCYSTTGGGYRVLQFRGGIPGAALVHTNSPTVFDGGGPRNWQVSAVADREFIAIGYVMCAAT